MRTAIVSDLHLGSSFGEDLLRDPAIRRLLLDEVRSADRLVLLGDALELRDLPLPDALELTRPFFEELGEAMAGREVLIVPGNHDHRLAEPLLEEVSLDKDGGLGLEQRGSPTEAPAATIDDWLGGASLGIAYPGVWLRDDVYATHGHYMDCHMSLPRIECLAAATMMRFLGPLPERATPAQYESILRPIYGFSFGLAQSDPARRSNRPSEGVWRKLSGRDRARSRTRRALVRAAASGGIPAVVWGINRILRSEFDFDLSAPAITRSGIEAATELTRRLQVDAAHVITGHAHRAGPEAGEPEWALPGGGRLHNTGSWIYSSALHRPGTPPNSYWPGTVTWLEEDGPPRRERLLHGHTGKELKLTAARGRWKPATSPGRRATRR